MQKIKKNDEVVVLSGSSRGAKGKVLKIFISKQKVLVEGVNVKKKSVRASKENPNGGFVEVPRPIHLSNVAIVSPKLKVATRVRIEKRDGKNVRVCCKCQTELP